MNTAKPFLKWAGGKTKLLSKLMEYIPKDLDTYLEPFLGGGALFFHLQPKNAILIDSNKELINCYKVVRDNVEELIDYLSHHYNDENYYYQIRNIDRLSYYEKWNSVQRASRFIFLNKTCYNGLYRVNSKGYFNVPFGGYKNPKILDMDNLRNCSKSLKNVNILNYSYYHSISFDGFFYFDPPYLPLNATSNFTQYTKEGFDYKDHIMLRDTCIDLDKSNKKFMVSNSSSPLILEMYKNFNINFVKAPRFINCKGLKRGNVDEVIITNYLNI